MSGLLSRVADNMYWFGRYAERAENTARLITVHTNLELDLPRTVTFGWEPLIAITGNDGAYRSVIDEYDESAVVHFLLAHPDHPGALLHSIAMARENLRTTRDVVPREVWEEITDLDLFARERLDAGLSRRGRHDYLQGIVGRCQRITGLLSGTLRHDAAYEFVRLGRNLERGDMTSRILDVRSEDLLVDRQGQLSPYDSIQWMSLLKSLTAYQMYRRHVRSRVTAHDVLRFLLQDRDFPRALQYCLTRIDSCLRRLPEREAPLRQVGRVSRQVQQANVRQLAADSDALSAYLDDLQLKLAACHNAIHEAYFGGDALAPAESAAAPSQSQSQTS